MSGLVGDWFRDVGGARWDDALLATQLPTPVRPSCMKTPRQVSVSIPLASAARSCADLDAVRCGRTGGSRCRPGGDTVTITESDRILGHCTTGQLPNEYLRLSALGAPVLLRVQIVPNMCERGNRSTVWLGGCSRGVRCRQLWRTAGPAGSVLASGSSSASMRSAGRWRWRCPARSP